MKHFYCPTCGNEIEIAEIDTQIESCQCDKCGSIMLETEVPNA